MVRSNTDWHRCCLVLGSTKGPDSLGSRVKVWGVFWGPDSLAFSANPLPGHACFAFGSSRAGLLIPKADAFDPCVLFWSHRTSFFIHPPGVLPLATRWFMLSVLKLAQCKFRDRGFSRRPQDLLAHRIYKPQ